MKNLPHPEDSTLVITPPNPPEEPGKKLNNLISSITLFAAFGLVAFVVIGLAAFVIRISVGDFAFRMGVSYFLYMMVYLALVVGLMIWSCYLMRVPDFKMKWEIEREEDREDPYDKTDYKYFGR